MSRFRLLVLFLAFASTASAEATFSLRNADSSSLFCWWAVPFASTKGGALGSIASAPSGRHAVAPGETVRINLSPGQDLLGVFLPWGSKPSLTTPLRGGWILASETPTKGTVLVDAVSFAEANRGRGVAATLQEWSMEVPHFVLDGQSDDWSGITALAEWGSGFRPAGGAPLPIQPKSLQLANREGALWLRLITDGRPVAAGTQVSLVLRLGAGGLEWPVTGADNRVLVWTSEASQTAGSRVRNGPILEARVPWDRLPVSFLEGWQRASGQWLWVVSNTTPIELAPFQPEDLP